MRGSLEAIQEAAVSFVESLREEDRVMFISFSSFIKSMPQESPDTEPVVAAIRAAQPGGATKLYEALLLAMKNLSVESGRKAIVVFSDGEDTGRTSTLNIVLNAISLSKLQPFQTTGRGTAPSKRSKKARNPYPLSW